MRDRRKNRLRSECRDETPFYRHRCFRRQPTHPDTRHTRSRRRLFPCKERRDSTSYFHIQGSVLHSDDQWSLLDTSTWKRSAGQDKFLEGYRTRGKCKDQDCWVKTIGILGKRVQNLQHSVATGLMQVKMLTTATRGWQTVINVGVAVTSRVARVTVAAVAIHPICARSWKRFSRNTFIILYKLVSSSSAKHQALHQAALQRLCSHWICLISIITFYSVKSRASGVVCWVWSTQPHI